MSLSIFVSLFLIDADDQLLDMEWVSQVSLFEDSFHDREDFPVSLPNQLLKVLLVVFVF